MDDQTMHQTVSLAIDLIEEHIGPYIILNKEEHWKICQGNDSKGYLHGTTGDDCWYVFPMDLLVIST